MALYVGEAVRIRASALDPETDQPLDPPPLSARVDFWRPGRNPARDASLRGTPDVGPISMSYRESDRDFVAFVSTGGLEPWEPGRWSYRVTVVGDAYENFEFGMFKLNE